ncbi:hypothetical protein VSDG_00444 [Cytospora chrysosperma]|uniref:MACPF domain-containing protein n=1 Tax=Cytospora chrysosperma TaxID=252740 RepID=A0A423WQG8_CYTCH|nr:hypothetical protein VSDG_00444 [Valsa sordida]
MDALKGVTAGVVDAAGNTLDTAGETLNKAADDIQGTEAPSTETVEPPSPESVAEDSIRVNLVSYGQGSHGGFYMKLSRLVRDGENLAALRNMIAGSTERKDVALLDFCSKSGIVVPDTYSIRDYIDECLKSEGDPAADGILDVYLKIDKDKTVKGNEPPKEGVVTEGQYADPIKIAQLRNELDTRAFMLLTGTGYKYPAQLEEQDWSVLAENNALCYGNCVVRRQEGDKTLVVGLERARYPAFRLKKRNLWSDRLTSKTAKDVMFYLRIPDFIVDDQSFVSIYETTSYLQSSLATSAFTSTDVSAAASGSLFGFSMSASASYGESTSTSSDASQASSNKHVTIAYNFPRVTVLLDEGSVELTMECQRDLAEVKDAKSLTKFLQDYGEFFSSRVQLGGRLFATEEVEESSTSSSKTEETKKAMKAAASASFGTFSASVSASHDSNASSEASAAASNAYSSLTWQARGGDTLLCNNPSEWCPTVADHFYWRITKQDKVFHLVDFIGTLAGFENIPKNLEEWRKTAGKVVKPQRVYLNRADRSPLGRYFEAFDPVNISLQRAAIALMKQDGAAVDKTVSARLYGMGAACLGNWTRSTDFSLLKWEFETEDGDNVCYETPYRLRHPIKGYVDFDRPSARFLYMTNEKHSKSFVMLREVGGDKTPKPVPQKSAGTNVTMHFVTKDNEKEEGFVYIACEEAGYQYLSVSPGPEVTSVTAIVMSVRLADY